MKSRNAVIRFLNGLFHFGWYFTIAIVGISIVNLVLNELGAAKGSSTILLPIEWHLLQVDPVDEFSINIKDANGNDYPLNQNIYAKISNLTFGYGEEKRTRQLAYLGYPYVILSGSLALFGVYQLRKLFQNFALGRYFETINATRIRRLGYVLFDQLALKVLIGFVFISAFSVTTGPNVDLMGDFGPYALASPILSIGLCLFAVAEVFREASKMRAEQELTI